ncbi:MAG: LysR substrate-binding domain-containing protein, partial [Oscillospiraceae bacterium]|nr:LysR substrate-binding domain-containing protein [Oscillospiraceae bacterium]
SRLEDELGVHLFERMGNKITINEFGRVFEAYVDRIFSELENAQKQLNTMMSRTDDDIRVGLPHTGLISNMILDYVAKNPDVHISQTILPVSAVRNQLLNGQLDFALSFVPPEDDRLTWNSYGTDGMSVMISEQHPLYSSPTIDLRQMADATFIINNSNTDLNTIFQTAFQEAGFAPRIIFGGDEPRLISALVKENKGIFLLPNVVNRLNILDTNPFGQRQGYRTIPLSFPRCNIAFGVCSLKDRTMNLHARLFYAYVCATLSHILTNRHLAL